MATKTKPYQIVVLIWQDAHADMAGSWVCVDDIDPDPFHVTSIGILLPHVKPGHVSIAQSIGGDIADHIIHVPNQMVRELTVISTITPDPWQE